MPWPGFEPGCLAALPPQDSVSTSFTTRAGRRKVESVPGGVNRGGAARRSALDWCPMELWVAFGFGALIGAFIGTLIGRHRAAARSAAAPPVVPPPPASRFAPPEVQHGVLDEREGTLKELGVKLVRSIPHELPMVACPMAQLTEMLMKLLDFALRRLRDSQPPRELRIAVSEAGPSLTISLWDSGTPLSVEAEQRLVTPFRFTQSAGGGEIEFALARALAQSSGGTLRLRPRPGGGAEVVVTLPKSVLAPLARATAATPSLPKLRILVVDDDAVNRQAMRLLLEREGHEVVAVENGLEAIERLGPASDRFDAVVTDLQMPRLGGRALYEQLREQRPLLAERFVFVTGDRARDETRRFLEECGQPAVMKPYDFNDLISAIGKVAGKTA